MTHDERVCAVCESDRQATSSIWWHVIFFSVLVVVGFAIGYGHP